MNQLSNLSMGLALVFVTFDWYLFQSIFLLKPGYNCCNSFALSWVDKVTNGTQSFVSVIENVAPWFATAVETITQFADQVKIIFIAQFINDISKVLQNLLRYFNGTIISTSFVPSLTVCPVTFCSKLNQALLMLASGKLIIAAASFTAGSSLKYFQKLLSY